MIFLASGFKGSGKDTLSEYLIKNKGFQRRAFADSLKDAVTSFLNLNRSILDDQTKKDSALLDFPVKAFDPFSKKVHQFFFKEFRNKENGQAITYEWYNNFLCEIDFDGFYVERKILYWTPRSACIFLGSVGRAFDSDHWVDKALPIKGTHGNVIVSDFRYKSEFDRVVEIFGRENVKTIRINRFDEVNSTDASERDLDNFEFDIRIDNKGTLQEFLENIKKEF